MKKHVYQCIHNGNSSLTNLYIWRQALEQIEHEGDFYKRASEDKDNASCFLRMMVWPGTVQSAQKTRALTRLSFPSFYLCVGNCWEKNQFWINFCTNPSKLTQPYKDSPIHHSFIHPCTYPFTHSSIPPCIKRTASRSVQFSLLCYWTTLLKSC